MEEQLISFETAKLAKEKGFKPERDWNPDYVKGYIEDAEHKLTEIQEEDWIVEGYYLAPTQSILQKWLREKKEIDAQAPCIRINSKRLRCYQYCIVSHNYTSLVQRGNFESYEEALEVGLQEALKLIKS